MSWVKDALEVARDLFTIGTAVVEAVRDDDPKRVEDIIPGTLKITLARKAAEIRAKEKFGT